MKKLMMTLTLGMTVLLGAACSPLPEGTPTPEDSASEFDTFFEIMEEPTQSETPTVDSDLLAGLTVRDREDDGKYEYPDVWKSANKYHVDAPMENCTVRQAVLYRDGENVELNDNCQPVKGTWTDPYTDITYGVGGAEGEPKEIRSLHIEHVVPMKNAYVSGASEWTDETYQTFAHDVNNLIVSEGSGNSSKGHRSPDEWKPADASYHCEYATTWVEVKTDWELSVTQSEKDALSSMLSTC